MIYIVTFNMQTGGPETAHQVGRELVSLGEDVSMFYLSAKKGISLTGGANTPAAYQKYEVPVANTIIDAPGNTVIIPETAVQLIHKIKYARIAVMWLSLGNYLKVAEQYMDRDRYADQVLKRHGLPKILKPAVMLRSYRYVDRYGFGYDFGNNRHDIHIYNCEYAKDFLISHGISTDYMTYVCGPISTSFSNYVLNEQGNEREDIVVYNPKKGADFTNRVIDFYYEIYGNTAKFIPIQGMSPQEVSKLLLRAKLYIDFGDFPGPERIPREAVFMGCNIITSTYGAAGNHEDVPIDDELKFDAEEENIPAIVNMMSRMLQDYAGYFHRYDSYRQKVQRQIADFSNEIEVLQGLIDPCKPSRTNGLPMDAANGER